MTELKSLFELIIEAININTEQLSPSQYAEKYRKLTSDVSTIQGKFRYDITPYLREVVDILSPYHPAKVIGVMKGAQIGYTEGAIVNGILWVIANNPGNIMWLAADSDLSAEAMESRLDQGLASCGLQHLIRPNTIRKRNNRTGDTSKSKEFAGGRLFGGSTSQINKLGKQRSIKYGFFDDYEAAPLADKEQGSVFQLLQQRFATAADTMKQFYISTPHTRPSNIEQVYLMGDQRKWHLPCPCCGDSIVIEWKQIKWEYDSKGHLLPETVHYECQSCKGQFKEKHKYDMNKNGVWIPTAKPTRPDYYSYHISALVAAPHMYNWTHYVYDWISFHNGDTVVRSKLKAFYNTVLGEPWQEKQTSIKRNALARNTRKYGIGTVPTAQSEQDGSGDIVMITAACDVNGNIDDGRLDYEVVAWSESGSCYSVDTGSIGTYEQGSDPLKRKCLSYRNEVSGSIWDKFHEVVTKPYYTDTGEEMYVLQAAVDTGYLDKYCWKYIDQHKGLIVGVKGQGTNKFIRTSADVAPWKLARERPNLYIITVDAIKDILAENISLKWKRGTTMPAGFMNFPKPSGEKYSVKNYFMQYENERKVIDENEDGEQLGWKWVRKSNVAPNHFWDVAVYNLALKDIVASQICRENGIKKGTWVDFVEIVKRFI